MALRARPATSRGWRLAWRRADPSRPDHLRGARPTGRAGPCRSGRRADDAADPGETRHALHRRVGRPGDDDLDLRRRRARRDRRGLRGASARTSSSRSRARRSTPRASGRASRAHRSAAPTPTGSCASPAPMSQGIGSYGNKQALATPIESILGEPVDPPAGIRVARDLVARREAAGDAAQHRRALTRGGTARAGRRAEGRTGRLCRTASDALAVGLSGPAAGPWRLHGHRPVQRGHHRRRHRHGRLRRRRCGLGLRASAGLGGPPLALPPGRLRLLGRQQPGRLGRPADLQVRGRRPRPRGPDERRHLGRRRAGSGSRRHSSR